MSENVLGGLATDETIKNETDSLGGFQVLDSDTYTFKLSEVFITKSKGGALGMTVRGKTADGKMLDQTLWVASGDAKGNKNYFINKKTNEKQYLPGFNVGNAIALLTLAENLNKLQTEPGLADVYGEQTKVDMIPAFAGQEITLGIIKQLVDKTQKDADTSEYVPTGESRAENEIDKVFRAKDGLTTVEIRGGIKEPQFKTKWEEKWRGEVKDRTTNVAAGVTAGAPAPTRPAGDAAPTELFK